MEDPSTRPARTESQTDATPEDAGVAAPVRCVLLAEPPVGEPPAPLLDALSRKRLAVTVCRTTFDVLAQILVEARAADEHGRPRAMALVVIEPPQVNVQRLRELLDALRIFAPRTVLWEYESGADVKLHALRDIAPPVHVRDDIGRAVATSDTAARLTRGPELRLAGVDEHAPTPRPSAADDEDGDGDGETSASDLLTEDEINMLLRDDGDAP